MCYNISDFDMMWLLFLRVFVWAFAYTPTGDKQRKSLELKLKQSVTYAIRIWFDFWDIVLKALIGTIFVSVLLDYCCLAS